MSVQVSTYIDEAKKQRFDEACEVIGISPSHALSKFIDDTIANNGIPSDGLVSPEDYVPPECPEELRAEMLECMPDVVKMADQYGTPLEYYKSYLRFNSKKIHKMSREEVFGCMRGQFEMTDDFDETLEDFAEYM
jgi:antitoxin component of RelBE/YafQ-DinJ toxin-antitoxin module